MKSTGIVRDVDNLGRIVLPIELRRTLGINLKDAVEIYTENDTIVLRKFQQACVFCGANESLTDFKDKKICTRCMNEILLSQK